MKKEEMRDFLEDALTSVSLESSGNNQFKNVGKELFNPKDVTGKTELSAKQINAMARLRFTARMLGRQLNPETNKPYTIEENIIELTDDVKIMAMSHKRKSRAEFVETHKILNSNPALSFNGQPPQQNTIR